MVLLRYLLPAHKDGAKHGAFHKHDLSLDHAAGVLGQPHPGSWRGVHCGPPGYAYPDVYNICVPTVRQDNCRGEGSGILPGYHENCLQGTPSC